MRFNVVELLFYNSKKQDDNRQYLVFTALI